MAMRMPLFFTGWLSLFRHDCDSRIAMRRFSRLEQFSPDVPASIWYRGRDSLMFPSQFHSKQIPAIAQQG
jgi:hypothetical protein